MILQSKSKDLQCSISNFRILDFLAMHLFKRNINELMVWHALWNSLDDALIILKFLTNSCDIRRSQEERIPIHQLDQRRSEKGPTDVPKCKPKKSKNLQQGRN